MLKFGSTGPEVIKLQKALLKEGYDLAVDGHFGHLTDAALRAFQDKTGISSDGIAGPTTLSYLYDDRLLDSLKNIDIKLVPAQAYNNMSTTRNALLANLHNKYGGLIQEAANLLQVPKEALYAVLAIETNGVCLEDNKPIIRLENHVLRRQLDPTAKIIFDKLFQFDANKPWLGHKFRLNINSSAWHNSHIWPATNSLQENQAREWQAIDVALKHFTEEQVFRSCSIGIGQIMGFNHSLVGAKSAIEMYDEAADERLQLIHFFKFIYQNGTGSYRHLASHAFTEFAKEYNGTGKATEYGGKISNFYQFTVQELKNVHTVSKVDLPNIYHQSWLA